MERILIKNLPLKILAFVCAAFLWLIVVNIDDPVTTKTFSNIKVTVVHSEIVTNRGRTYRIQDDSDNVSVVVSAKRSVLNDINAEDIAATADMKEMVLGSQIPIEVSINKFEGKYTDAYSVPKNLQVTIEENANNKFPIQASTTGTPRDGYTIGSAKADPETVTIGGPESIVNQIAKVVAEVNVSGLSKDAILDSELVLYDFNDKQIADTTLLTMNIGDTGVTVEVSVHKVKALPLEFDTTDITMAPGYYLGEITCEPKDIQVTGNSDNLKDLLSILIPREALKMEGLTEKTEVVLDVTPYLPEKVGLVEENGGSVVVTINVEQGGVKTFNFPVASISVSNAPVGYKWSYGETEEIVLKISGSNDVLAGLTLKSGDVSINLADYQSAGVHKVPIEVDLPEGCTLVNNVSIELTLEKE